YRVVRQIVGEKLQRYKPAKNSVLCLIDHTHPSAAELLRGNSNDGKCAQGNCLTAGVHPTRLCLVLCPSARKRERRPRPVDYDRTVARNFGEYQHITGCLLTIQGW